MSPEKKSDNTSIKSDQTNSSPQNSPCRESKTNCADKNATKNRPKSLTKKILFRFLAVLLSLSPLFFFETLCRVNGWGNPVFYDDPYVGFSEIHPLFFHNEETDRYEISPSRYKFFNKDSFPAQKPPDQTRIFVLGGSTVQGRPYEIHTAFSTWLELSLKAAEPDRDWDVINCGGISYASYRLVPILQEVLQYEPDLIIVCTGHNEFLEDRTYDSIKNRSTVLSWPAEQVSRLRTYNILRGKYLAITKQNDTAVSPERPTLGPEVDARLDVKGGIEKYHRDDDWRQGVIEHFTHNLKRMVHITNKAKVPLIYVCPVSNLDWPPFKAMPGEDLSSDDRAHFETLLQQFQQTPAQDIEEKISVLERMRSIDNRHPLVHYELGQWYREARMYPQARQSFERAIEEDICPLRMLAPMRKNMITVAESLNVPLVNVHALFTQRSKHNITNDQWLMIDHVHPSITGHKLVAEKLLHVMEKQNMVSTQSGWESVRDQSYQQQMKNLHPSYFSKGEARLKGVLRWGFGKVKLERKTP